MKKAILCLWLVLAMGWISPAAAKAEAATDRRMPFALWCSRTWISLWIWKIS